MGKAILQTLIPCIVDVHFAGEDGEIEGKRIKRQTDSSVEEAQRESLFEGCQTGKLMAIMLLIIPVSHVCK